MGLEKARYNPFSRYLTLKKATLDGKKLNLQHCPPHTHTPDPTHIPPQSQAFTYHQAQLIPTEA